MSDYDPFDGKDAAMVSTMEEFAKAVKGRTLTIRRPNPVTAKVVSGIHMGIFDCLIEVAQYSIRRDSWLVHWIEVGTDRIQSTEITVSELQDYGQLDNRLINTTEFLRKYRQQCLQRLTTEKMRDDHMRFLRDPKVQAAAQGVVSNMIGTLPLWQQDVLDRFKAEGQAAAQHGADILERAAKAKVPPYQFNDNMRAAANITEAMVDAMMTGTGIARMYSDQIGEPRAVVLNPDHICRISVLEPERDGTQPVPRKAEVIEPDLITKKIREW